MKYCTESAHHCALQKLYYILLCTLGLRS